jgi:hypothetical protein
MKKNVHSPLEVDFTETLKLKYETKPPKLSSHGEEDELGGFVSYFSFNVSVKSTSSGE